MGNRAAVMTALQEIQIEDRPLTQPGPRQCLVRIESVGVCGSDTAYFTRGRIGDWVVDGPIILGHEVSGQVEQVGPEVTRVVAGDRVAIEPGTPDRDCPQCRAGNYHLCPNLEFFATPPYDGALVERLVIDERNLFVLPEGMSYDQGALLEPLSVGIWGCRRAGLVPGDDVLITGAGPVGLVSAAVARAFGAASVTITDISEFRLDLARGMGFQVEDGREPGAGDFDVLIECSGARGALADGLRRLRPAGRAAMVGNPKDADVPLPLASLMSRELTLSWVHRYNNTWPLAIALVASGRVDVQPLITHHFPLAETAAALTLASRVPDSVKAIVHPQQ